MLYHRIRPNRRPACNVRGCDKKVIVGLLYIGCCVGLCVLACCHHNETFADIISYLNLVPKGASTYPLS